MKRKLLRTSLYLLITSLLTILALEASLRVWQFVRNEDRVMVSDPILHHRLRRDLEVIDRHRDVPYTLKTNKQSWVEDHEISVTRGTDTFRIFFVGDSTTQGVVGQQYKVTTLVEERLNQDFRTREFEVINTGTSSYSPLIYYLQIKTELLDYSPDLVVITVDMTDVVNDDFYRNFLHMSNGEFVAVGDIDESNRYKYHLTPQGVVIGDKISPMWTWFVNKSSIAYYADKVIARQKWKGIKAKIDAQNYDRSANWLQASYGAETLESIEFTADVLRRTISLLQQNGVGVLLTAMPHYQQYTGGFSTEPHDIIARIASDNKVGYLNSYEALRGYIEGSSQEEYYWSTDDGHFNIEGNRIWAEAVYDWIKEEIEGLNIE